MMSYSSTWDKDVHCQLHYQRLWYIQYPDNVVSSVTNSVKKYVAKQVQFQARKNMMEPGVSQFSSGCIED